MCIICATFWEWCAACQMFLPNRHWINQQLTFQRQHGIQTPVKFFSCVNMVQDGETGCVLQAQRRMARETTLLPAVNLTHSCKRIMLGCAHWHPPKPVLRLHGWVMNLWKEPLAHPLFQLVKGSSSLCCCCCRLCAFLAAIPLISQC